MRAHYLILIISFHAISATIDIQKLKEQATSTILQLHQSAKENIQRLKDDIDFDKLKPFSLEQLKENAKENIQQLVADIDLEKVKKLDFLGIIPKVYNIKTTLEKPKPSYLPKNPKAIYKPAKPATLYIEPNQVQRLRNHFKKTPKSKKIYSGPIIYKAQYYVFD